jgi:hypothetical protein
MRQRDEVGNVASDSERREGHDEAPSSSRLHAMMEVEKDGQDKRRHEEDELEDRDTRAVRYGHGEGACSMESLEKSIHGTKTRSWGTVVIIRDS